MFDVAIIGGGPAGSAAAITLARRGLSVALVEKTKYDHSHIGETLVPAARAPLAKLGAWEQFLRDQHMPSPANISAWGTSELEENHFIFNPYGIGWHIDRARFDAMLAQVAEKAGACVWRESQIDTFARGNSGEWRIGSNEITARFLIDATGRAGSASRRIGARRVAEDRLVGLVAFFGIPRGGGAATRPAIVKDNRTLVESAKDGWWYSAALPDERVVIAFMTDADLLPSSRAEAAEYWQAQLTQTVFTRERQRHQVVTEKPETLLKTFSAASYITNPIYGANWLAVGDAAFAFDPLSSQGIYNALDSGLRAAKVVAQLLSGDANALQTYADWAESRFEKFLLKRNWYYNQERRWSASDFWKRRHRLIR